MSIQRTTPDLSTELALADGSPCVVGGLDEVGRGAWAGPVVVGVVVIGPEFVDAPTGVRDSKLIPEARRPAMAEAVKHWCSGWAVGRASPLEIDELGMARALGLASWRALGALAVPPRFLIVDGAIDFVTRGMSEAHEAGFAGGSGGCPGVTTLVGADRTCLTVAAASIVAKVSRDTELRALAGDEPRFGFDRNKGYGTREHEDAIRAHGLTSHHRSSWSFGARLSQEETLLNRPGRSLSRGRIAAHESAAVGPEPPGAVQDAQGGRHRS